MAGCRCNPGPQHVHDAPSDITTGAISDCLLCHDITREGDPKREHCKYLFSEAVHAFAVSYQCLSAVLKVGRNKKIRGDIKICQRTFLVCITCPLWYWISACCCYPCLCTLKTVRMHSSLMQRSIMTPSNWMCVLGKKRQSFWVNNFARHLVCSVFFCQGVWTLGRRSASPKMWWWRSSTFHPIEALWCFWKDRRELRGSHWRTLPMTSTTPA